MKTQVLVVDANTAFATMIKQALEDLGEFQVTMVSAAPEAIGLAAQEPFDLAIVDMGLPDVTGEDTVRGLRATRPHLPVIVIPFNADAGDPMFQPLDIQGFLSKPFFLPDLAGIIEEAMDRPVNGVAPPPRKKPARATAAVAEAAASATPPPARAAGRTIPAEMPAWLKDGAAATPVLAGAVRQTSAEAGLLASGDRPVAQAGPLTQAVFEELARLVLEAWSPEKRGSQNALMRYVKLSDGGPDYLLYATAVTLGSVLALIYKADVQVGLARKQAKEAAAALLQPPASQPGSPASGPGSASASNPPRPAPATAPLPPEALFDFAPGAAAEPQPSARLTEVVPATQTPRPPTVVVDSGLQLPADISTPDVGRTPHALYSLTYTVVWAPKFPRTRLIGGLTGLLHEWIRHLGLSYDWRVDRVEVRPECVIVIVSCSPATAPEHMVNVLKKGTSDRALAEFRSLAADHPAGDLWAPGYLLLGAGQSLTPQQVNDFLAYTRRGQGVGR